VFADLDDFKRVNDLYGHHVGDSVLRAFADVIRGRVRAIDLAARLGGEEFAILLLETDLNGAEALAEVNLRSVVASMEYGSLAARRCGLRPASASLTTPVRAEPRDLMSRPIWLVPGKTRGKNTVKVSQRPPFEGIFPEVPQVPMDSVVRNGDDCCNAKSASWVIWSCAGRRRGRLVVRDLAPRVRCRPANQRRIAGARRRVGPPEGACDPAVREDGRARAGSADRPTDNARDGRSVSAVAGDLAGSRRRPPAGGA
jgi:hypothetical protein